jgi:hypothetical protein
MYITDKVGSVNWAFSACYLVAFISNIGISGHSISDLSYPRFWIPFGNRQALPSLEF